MLSEPTRRRLDPEVPADRRDRGAQDLAAGCVCIPGAVGMPTGHAPLSTTVGMHHKGLSEPRWRHLNPFAPLNEGEAEYLAYKYQGLHESHFYSCLCIVACTVVFATIYWGDQYLEGTIFPQVRWHTLANLVPVPVPRPRPRPSHCPLPTGPRHRP